MPVVPPLEPASDVHETGCPNAPGWAFVSQSSGLVIPATCRRLACRPCLLACARKRSLALSFARPERAILLTDAGEDWSVIRPRVFRLRHLIAKETGHQLEWAYHVEPNPSGDGRHHVHAWSHGAYVPQRTLSGLSRSVGMGSVAFINRVRSTAGAGQYGLKGLGYGLKGTAGVESAATYLRLNGRRLEHHSRGFYRAADGATMGVRAAEQAAIRVNGKDSGPWVLTRL